MPDEGSAERNALRAALRPGRDCPPVEQLASLLDGAAPLPPDLARHVETCAHCSTEMSLLREFQSGIVQEAEAEPVRLITERLRARTSEIVSPRVRTDDREPWWKTFWTARWLGPAALAAAAVFILLAVSFQWRQSAPGLHAPAAPEQDVLRSGAITVISPAGDVQQAPTELRWQPAKPAVKYRVRLLEVDRTELWKAETSQDRIDLPGEIRAKIVPHKTLLWEVSGLDLSGRVVAESGVRFRFLQNVYKQ